MLDDAHRSFRHILIPTDGSDRSARAIEQGMQLAQQLAARITGVHAIGPFTTFAGSAELLAMTPTAYEAWSRRQATKILDVIVKSAGHFGVTCEVESVVHDRPSEAILEAARRGKCDLIVMASHARRGLKGLLLGSECENVMTHAKIPVLVIR